MTAGTDLIEVCTVDQVSPDLPAQAIVAGESVAVFQVGSDYFVTQDLCTHGPGLLSEGYVDGGEVECPFHQGKFDIATGNPTAPPCMIALKTWRVVMQGDRICVRLP